MDQRTGVFNPPYSQEVLGALYISQQTSIADINIYKENTGWLSQRSVNSRVELHSQQGVCLRCSPLPPPAPPHLSLSKNKYILKKREKILMEHSK